jgi:hypothetical protein
VSAHTLRGSAKPGKLGGNGRANSAQVFLQTYSHAASAAQGLRATLRAAVQELRLLRYDVRRNCVRDGAFLISIASETPL